MFRLFRQFVALLLTIWLPLFSGNALAVSIVMQAQGSCCPAGTAQLAELHAHHAGAQHDQPAAHQDRTDEACDQHSSQHVQHSSSCSNCGTCHLAGSGYLAAAAVEVAEAQSPAQSFRAIPTRFQSAIPTLLDPPPLARV
ncbi:MAG TPA: hypothetical protein VFK88_01470 [Gallionella sp.]|nr:hypothetical protein [Gallionella sp.]